MTKKILALFLSAFMLLGMGLTAVAEEGELLKNGGFERIIDNAPANWSIGGKAEKGVNYTLDTAVKHGGETSLKLMDKEEKYLYAAQQVNVVAGAKYKVSGWVYPVNLGGGGIAVKVEFYTKDEAGKDAFLDKVEKNFKDIPTKKWTQLSLDVTAPADCTSMSVLFRMNMGKELYFDDLSIAGEKPAEAPVEELLQNGGLEEFSGDKPYLWTIGGGVAAGTNYTSDSKTVHGGSLSLKLMDNAEKNMYASQNILIVGGTKYTTSAWVYPIDLAEGGTAIKIEYYGVDENGDDKYLDKTEKNFKTLSVNKWNEIGFEFEAPQDAYRISILFRMNMGKELYFDDLSLIGQKAPAPAPKASEDYIPLPAGEKELLTNLSFEELDENGYPVNWNAYKGWSTESEHVFVEKESTLDGDVAIRLKGANNPWVSQRVYNNFKKDEVYQMSAWVRIPADGAFGYKLEWYDENEVYIEGFNTSKYSKVTGEGWVQIVYHMTIGADCSSVMFLARNFAKDGNLIVDNLSFYRIAEAPRVYLDTDEYFYYTEEAEKGGWGTADMTLNTVSYPEIAGSTLTFRIRKDAEVVFEAPGLVPLNNTVSVDFPISVLKEEWTEYTAEAIIIGADGSELGKKDHFINKYPRPTYLNENGKVVLPDGEVMNPALWYHVDPADYAALAAAGGTVVQSRYENASGILTCLDAAEKAGIKVMAALYKNMMPAGHPDNVDNTKEVINKVKDHPALLGYMVMDEPSSYFGSQLNLFYDSYKLIRSLDPAHPVYIVEAKPGYYDIFQKYVDILSIDPYPGIVKGGTTIDHVLRYAEQAVETTGFEKPVWAINQATGYEYMFPNEAQIRNMFYSSLYGGATAVGHFSWYDATEWMDNKMYKDTDRLDMMTNLYTKGDTKTAYAHFVDRVNPIFKEQTFDKYWVSAYVKNGAVYMYVANRGAENVAVDIPLTSDGGAVSIGAYTANIVFGDTNVNSERVGNGSLQFTLDGDSAYLWKITPSEAVDFSALKTSAYRDTHLTPWAAEAIRELDSRDIVNDITATSFAPQRKITRADFAYFYVRTLGLTADTAENFADVNPNAYYAKELAIGRALGILQGVGDNKYNPEAEISRQDLMTIIARGMEINSAGTDLSAFSDSAEIADYALEGVRAMVASGLVKGNADGTLNPKGNTTRAEAAVIMKRILDR